MLMRTRDWQFYDSLDASGQVSYQNALTPANKGCFDVCDGIFLNYWWNAEELAQSVALAGPQVRRVVCMCVNVMICACFSLAVSYFAALAMRILVKVQP